MSEKIADFTHEFMKRVDAKLDILIREVSALRVDVQEIKVRVAPVETSSGMLFGSVAKIENEIKHINQVIYQAEPQPPLL